MMARRENIFKSLEEKSLRFIAMINDEKTYQFWSFLCRSNSFRVFVVKVLIEQFFNFSGTILMS